MKEVPDSIDSKFGFPQVTSWIPSSMRWHIFSC